MIHCLRPLPCQNNHSESIGEGPKNNGYMCFFEVRYLPRYPISGLLRINSLIIFVISKVFKAVQNHNNSALAISTTSIITLTMLLGFVGSTHLWSDGIANQVETSWKINTQFIVYDVNKSSLDIGELLSQLNKGTMNEGLVLSLARRGTCNMDKKN